MQPIHETTRKLVIALGLALILALSVPVARPAFARETFAREALLVHIVSVGRIVDDGQAVRVHVLVRCALPGVQVLEAFIYVVQDGRQSNFAGLPVTCGPRPRIQLLTVRVSALDFSFQRGTAQASAFILLLDPVTQQTVSAGDSRALTLLGNRR
jgi:hypothetical protein